MTQKYKDDDELNTWEASDVAGLERSTMATYRSTGKYNLHYLKKRGKVYYKYSDLMKFKEDETKYF